MEPTVQPTTPTSDRSRPARLAAHGSVSGALGLLSDRRLSDLLAAAPELGSGIGGRSALLQVDGIPVFVKRIPLTDLECLPEYAHSTANLFQVPLYCQYGVGSIGSPGFGAWRELAVHTLTTGWVLGDTYQGFPLMYHWRVLPNLPPELPEELADVEAAVAYWDGSPAIRKRIEAIAESTASLVLFLEYLPQTLHSWLTERLAEGGAAAEAACTLAERELAAGTELMNSHGLLHFDGHFENLLTDGERVYFSDFGLSIHAGFELTEAEADFFRENHSYDRTYTESYLTNWLVAAIQGLRGAEREALVRDCAEGAQLDLQPPAAARIITQYAPITTVMWEFYRTFQHESRTIRYPTEAIELTYRRRSEPNQNNTTDLAAPTI